MKNKGITLIALVITIIVLLILAGVSLSITIGKNGILNKSREAKIAHEKATIKEEITMESVALYREREEVKSGKRTDQDVFGILQSKLEEKSDLKDTDYLIKSKFMMITTKQGYIYTVLYDGTVLEGKYACLDIADGNIDLYSNGYKQYTGNLKSINKNNSIEYVGNYLITGTTTEYVVRVCDEGKYDIIIRNLNIDVSGSSSGICAFNANRGYKSTGCFVNLILEGNNYLQGKSAPGLGFAGATPNVDGVTNGSTIKLQGNGSLEAKGNGYAAGIGGGYTGIETSAGDVSNIIIDSGNISAIGGSNGTTHGAGIGGTIYKNVNNIIINGGNVNAKGGFYIAGIGAGDQNAIADNIVINGGNVNSNGIGAGYLGITGRIEINGGNLNVSASYGCGAIGSYNTSETGLIKITGGNINATSTIGDKIQNITIEGGTINLYSSKSAGISCYEEGNIKITGGNIFVRGKDYPMATYGEGTNLMAYTPTNGISNLYVTSIKLQDVGGNKKIESLTTSDNIEYGTKDIYTFEDDTSTTGVDETGMIYLYLPLGSRTITIKVDGQTYSNTVETKAEESEVITLNKI